MDISEYLAHFPFQYVSYGWKGETVVILNEVRFLSDFGNYLQGEYVERLYLDYKSRRFWSNCRGRDTHYDILPRFTGLPATRDPRPEPVSGS